MMASKSSPHLQGFRVTSNVQRSMIRLATPYCAADLRMPGTFSVVTFRIRQDKLNWGVTPCLSLSFVDRRCQNRKPRHQSTQWSRIDVREYLAGAEVTAYIGHTTRPNEGIVYKLSWGRLGVHFVEVAQR